MSEEIFVALLVGICTILGSLTTGIITYLSASQAKELASCRGRLARALRDVSAFHRLEARYIKLLATEKKSEEAWKREVRKEQRELGFDTPSSDATSTRAEEQIKALGA